jgi:RimJ/RimL family protein N-acetyltransferase
VKISKMIGWKKFRANVVEIDTPRLLIRTLFVSDVSQEYVSWLNDKLVSQYLESRNRPQTLSSVRSFVRRSGRSRDGHLFGIFLKSNFDHIGNIRLHSIDSHHLSAEVGFLIGSSLNWGKGYASEAIAGVSCFAGEKLGLKKITAGLYESNAGSRRALEKAGFELEGLKNGQVVKSDGTREGVVQMGLIL